MTNPSSRHELIPKWARKAFIGIMIGGVLLLVALGIAELRQIWQRPLGPTLVPTSAGMSTEASPIAAKMTQTQTPTPEDTATPTLTPTATPEPLCGLPSSMTVLALGIDSFWGFAGRADAVRLVTVDAVNGKVATLAFPRDMYVRIPGFEQWGIVDGKLGAAFAHGNKYFPPDGGPNSVARVFAENFGVSADHYAAIYRQLLISVVDALGGIPVYVPYTVYPFTAGEYWMSGTTLQDYLTIRMDDSDWQRMRRHNQVLLALRDRLLTPQGLAAAPQLIDALYENVLTDYSLEDVLKLFCLGQELDLQSIAFYEFPREALSATTTEAGYVFLWDDATIRQYVSEFLQGDYTHLVSQQ